MTARISRWIYLLLIVGLPLVTLMWWGRWEPRPLQAGTQPSVIISEVAWGGTAASTADEWLELYNASQQTVSLAGWRLSDGGNIDVTLGGTLPPGGFYLLERTDDQTVSDIPASQLYSGSLANSGETLSLLAPDDSLVDSANLSGGSWDAGSGGPLFLSMERRAPDAPDNPAGWVHHNQLLGSGRDAAGDLLNGTPGSPNASWIPLADLAISGEAPLFATSGEFLMLELTVINQGLLTGTGVVLSSSLPSGVMYVTHSSGVPVTQLEDSLQWELGELPPQGGVGMVVTTAVVADFSGSLTFDLLLSTTALEGETDNNTLQLITQASPDGQAVIQLDAVHFSGQALNQADEAVRLSNSATQPFDLSGWQLSDGSSTLILPEGVVVPAGGFIWLAKEGDGFAAQFGFAPAWATAPGESGARLLPGGWPGYADGGDEVILRDAQLRIVDVLVYGSGDTSQPGWEGDALQPYRLNSSTPLRGQILYRKRQQVSGRPLSDTDTRFDWAQEPADVINGRKILYPGWELMRFFTPAHITNTATLTIAIAPDNAFETLVAHLNQAQTSIEIETHTFENLAIAEALLAAAKRGVSVTVLLEGAPPGGLPQQQKYICQQLELAGGACWFMVNLGEAHVYDRYTYMHAKLAIIDGQVVMVGSENLSPNSLPADSKLDGTWGRRGVLLFTDAPEVVAHVQALFDADFNPQQHADLFRFDAAHPSWGGPQPGFVPMTATGGITYAVRFPEPLVLQGVFPFEIVQSPENSLRTVDSLLGLVGRVGAGDQLLVQQLSERPFWGASTSDPLQDPNPRLEAYVAAARRGGSVWLLLDAYFDDDRQPNSNTATCVAINALARAENLDLHCRLANPTGLGIHNKMLLAYIDGQGYVHVGSLNGTEQAHKGNRELVLQIQTGAGYVYLAEMFFRDWPHRQYLPLMSFEDRLAATYPLINELLYDPFGPDQDEWIEIVNPLRQPFDLSDYSLSDAQLREDFADLRRFPPGTVIPPRGVIVIAQQGVAFEASYGFYPDFEVLDSTTAVADLIDDPLWGDPAAFLQWGNNGDVVLLRDPLNHIVDGFSYGEVLWPPLPACPSVEFPGRSLRRITFWQDFDDCSQDYEVWPDPLPAQLP